MLSADCVSEIVLCVVMNKKDDLMMMMCDVCSAGDTRQTPRHRALASVSGPHSSPWLARASVIVSLF